MARKSKSADGWQSAEPHPALRKIISWSSKEKPSPDELIEWLIHQQNQILPYLDHIYSLKEHTVKAEELKDEISTGDYVRLHRWRKTYLLLLDYLDVIDGAADNLEGTTAGRVSDAFSQGVRLGILHERLLSFVDGRCQDHWTKQETGKKAADTANAAKARKRPDYLSAVKDVMATDVKYHPACEQVAVYFDVSKETVKNHTKELAPGQNRKNA